MTKIISPSRRYRKDGRSIRFTLDVKKESLEAILGAAYLMTDLAYAELSGSRKTKLGVTLTPKDGKGLDALAKRFLAELESQKVRWAVAKNNQSLREYVAEQAVLLANGRLEPEPTAPEQNDAALTDDQRAEIEKLIAEVEDEIKAMNEKKLLADPKNVRPSWEAQQAERGGAGAAAKQAAREAPAAKQAAREAPAAKQAEKKA